MKNKTTSQLRKGILEYCILLTISANDAYASDIIATLKESKLIIVEGTLYPLLTRLKNAGYLDYRWEESSQGPPRKYYSITSSGNDFLRELDEAWSGLEASIQTLKNHIKQK